MEKYITQLPDSFACCIFLYNNIFRKTHHPEYSFFLEFINGYYPKYTFEAWAYIKTLLIQKILSISSDYIDINYSIKQINDLFIPKTGAIATFINNTSKLCIQNRKSIHHTKINTQFLTDVLYSVDFGITSNVIIIYLFDICTMQLPQ